MSGRRPAAELLATPGALVDRERLRELGLDDRGVDSLLAACTVVCLPGLRRVYVPAEEAQVWLEREASR